jgi:hypothetical protein
MKGTDGLATLCIGGGQGYCHGRKEVDNMGKRAGLEGKVALVNGGSRVNIYEINEIVVS